MAKIAIEADTQVIPGLVLLDSSVIKADQDTIKSDLSSLDGRIHANLIQCYLHAEKHGDTSLVKRLLLDIVGKDSGYRRQGMIAHMKAFTPMRLEGDVIKLNGMKDGLRQVWNIDKANETPFWNLASAREMVPQRPIFRDGLTSKLERAVKEYKDAVANTILEPGKEPRAKVVGKPFYCGNRMDEIEKSFDQITGIVGQITSWNDPTKDIFGAKQQLAKAQLEAADAEREEEKNTPAQQPLEPVEHTN